MILFAFTYLGFVAFLLVVLVLAHAFEWLTGRCVFDAVSNWLGREYDELERVWELPCAPNPEVRA